MKIRPKLTFTYLVISLIALIVTSTISYNIAKKSLTEKVLNQLESVATIQKNRLESIIEQNLERLNLISSRTQLRLSLEEYIRDPKEKYQNKINLILRDVRSSIASLRDVSVLTLDGKIMASTDSVSIGTHHSGEAYFLGGKEKGCADIFFFNEDMKLRVYLAGPLYLENKLLGVIVVESDVENIISLVEDYTGLGKTGEMLLAKRAENNDALLLMPLRFDKEAALTRTISHKELQDPIIQALSGKVQFLTDALDYRGETVLAVTQYISKTHWGVVVKIDKTEAFAPVFQLYNLLTLIIVISSLIVILVSYFSARSITRPIIDLRNVVSKISEGDLSQRVEMISKDEIGVSALAINNLLQESTGMGESGESYLVGNVEGKNGYWMLSQSRFSTENTVFTQPMNTVDVLRVLGEKVTERSSEICQNNIYPNYMGINVLGHNHYLEVGEFGWGLMTEIDEAEVFQASTQMMMFIICAKIKILTNFLIFKS